MMTNEEQAQKAWSDNALEFFKLPWVEVAKKMYVLGLKGSKEEFEWNLYHDMDNRNYNDVEKIKALEEENKNLKKKLKALGFVIE